jgi:hypothetical protein
VIINADGVFSPQPSVARCFRNAIRYNDQMWMDLGFDLNSLPEVAFLNLDHFNSLLFIVSVIEYVVLQSDFGYSLSIMIS